MTITKVRAKPISNEEIIRILTVNGVNINKYAHEMKQTYYVPGSWKSKNYISYRIPIDVYTKWVGKKFVAQRKIGDIVRVRRTSSREWNQRREFGQDVGDIYKWGHLGIGSGKNYESDETKGIGNSSGYGWNRNPYHKCKQVLTLGTQYICNKTQALKKRDFYQNNPYIIVEEKWSQDIDIHNFYEVVTLEPTGLFGPKKLINGAITEVYVHFIDPKWKTKREARYHVKFETGAEGIFTADMLDRVFDTDFEVDERMSICEHKECTATICRHRNHHVHDESCERRCKLSKEICKTVYDYTQFAETTIQRGLLDGEK